MAAVAAQHTNRTLVYPPEERMYLVGSEPSGLDYWVNMDRLRSGIPAMSLAEFLQKEGKQINAPEILTEWAKDSEKNDFPRAAWRELRAKTMTSAGSSDEKVCDMTTYEASHKMIYTDPADGARMFGCGNWPNVGEPRFHISKNGEYAGQWNAPPAAFMLLRNHFMWHPDAFDIASKVVDHLGTFKYVSVHARYGDFQFQNHKRVEDTLLHDGWLSGAKSFLQVNSQGSGAEDDASGSLVQLSSESVLRSGSSLRARLSTSRGQRVAGLVRRWLDEDSSRHVYIATDENTPEFKKPFKDANVNMVTWSDLLEQGHKGEGPLKDVLGAYSKERLSNLAGPVEQLICTFGKVFIGSEKSTFTGYIERMRLYAQAPTHATFIKYAGEAASDMGLRMFHDRAINPDVEQQVSELIETWDNNGGKLDRSDPGLLPLDAS
jgi:hypothetical protein